MSANIQNLRLRRPPSEKPTESVQKPARHAGILQDQVRRTARPPWSPGFATALRMLLIIRVMGAMYSNIDDCDEVYNFWEPLHLLHRGYGFQTWEVSPEYSIRSWAYVLLHLPTAVLSFFLSGGSKRAAFFGVRIFLACTSALTEVVLYRSVYEKINQRVGRYLFFMLIFNTGMWNASAALLPSSFAMYTTTCAFAAILPPSSLQNSRRTLFATLLFATGAVVGWPFSLALAIPFVIEELFVRGQDRVSNETRTSWLLSRWKRLFSAGLLASLLFVPVIGIDSLAYGKLSVVPWNIISYNILSSGRGPDLYGTSPWHFYFLNLLLNFNILLPLALLSLPALFVTSIIDRKRLGITQALVELSSPFTILGLRLAPFYLWFAILTMQAHKEERFMFPVYPLLCFNAAITLYLMRGWMETTFVFLTKSPYRASRSSIFSSFTSSVVVFAGIVSLSRIFANWNYYHAPMSIAYVFESRELPSLLNSTDILHPPLPPPDHHEQRKERLDLSQIAQFNLTLCIGKEWHRFPGHYLVPDGVKIEFVKSEFNGLLPGHFPEIDQTNSSQWWFRPETRISPTGFNDLNKEEPSHYVPITQCSYLIDLDFPFDPIVSSWEPRYATDATSWDRVACVPFLDSRNSPLISRVLWVPGSRWRTLNQWGDYCLLRNRREIDGKVKTLKKSNNKLNV